MGATVADVVISQISGSDGLTSQLQAFCVSCLVCLGLAKAVTVASAGLQFIWRQFLRPAKKLTKYGKWAIVTGATDGIGRAYCDQLAKQGMSIYLISRTEAKLQEAAAQISQKYGVETKYYAADLAAAGKVPIDHSCWYGLKSNINGMDVGVLINNAGVSHSYPEYVHLLDSADVDDMIALNCSALTKMVYTVLPGMVERGRGAILNISSASAMGTPASPLLSIYAGSKAFVDVFSRSLAAEYESKGIHVQAQGPALVATKLSKVRRANIMAPTPPVYTSYGVRYIGYEPTAVPYPTHAIQQFMIMDVIPRKVAVGYVLSTLRGLRAKALKKKAAATKAQ